MGSVVSMTIRRVCDTGSSAAVPGAEHTLAVLPAKLTRDNAGSSGRPSCLALSHAGTRLVEATGIADFLRGDDEHPLRGCSSSRAPKSGRLSTSEASPASEGDCRFPEHRQSRYRGRRMDVY